MLASDWAARKLGYRFSDPGLLDAALTHRSAGPNNYERLEFLGDALLNFVVARLLFKEFPDASEGDLSRYRAALVSAEPLAEIATELALGSQLQMGAGELKSGGHRRGSILADAFEAVLAAVYLDGGIEAAASLLERTYTHRLTSLPEAEALKDSKTRLQELLQSRGDPLPTYTLEEVSGEPHDQWFLARCEVVSMNLMRVGEGSSRRRAEQEAAQKALEALSVDSGGQ
mgnify:CR=1 FL=1